MLPLDVLPTCVQPVVAAEALLDQVTGGPVRGRPGQIDLARGDSDGDQVRRRRRRDRDSRLGGGDSRGVSVTVSDCVPAVSNVSEKVCTP